MALDERVEALKNGLAAALPDRVVTRNLQDVAARDAHDLGKGIFTLLTLGEGDFPNFVGREAALGTQRMIIIGQQCLPEEAKPVDVERAEIAMAADLKGFCAAAMPAGVDQLLFLNWQGSGQTEFPYASIMVDLEMS